MAKASSLLAAPPVIERWDVLGAKLDESVLQKTSNVR
jgi:hypothetical protein